MHWQCMAGWRGLARGRRACIPIGQTHDFLISSAVALGVTSRMAYSSE